MSLLPFLLMAAATNGLYQFSSNAGMVVLHATVIDRKGGFTSGLKQGDFQISEDGVTQPIKVFQQEDTPVAVGLLVDNSGSMRRKRSDVSAAALAFMHQSNPADEVFLINFNDRVSFGLPSTKLFTADFQQLVIALSTATTGGKTSLYDALKAGLDHIRKSALSRKVLIVISDGGDNASKHTFAQVVTEAESSDVTIYAVGLFDEYDKDRNPKVLNTLVKVTGGQAFYPPETPEVVSICQRIAADIRHQYTIGYVPANQEMDGRFRAIHVTAKPSSGARLAVRTRSGYLARQ
jgi:Ca-activated chloride channel homolog